MTQVTNGIHSILSSPFIYNTFQNLMGVRRYREELVSNHIKARVGNRILDLGCGTAEILNYLPSVDYHGFDIYLPYIASARKTFGDKGKFEQRILSADDAEKMPKFDIVLALGVLHHLDDNLAENLLNTAYAALVDGGKLVTMDPLFTEKQNPIARYLINKDRGKNVRNVEGYTILAKTVFKHVNTTVKHRVWVPYTHCISEYFR